jgi:hypothetical protein
MLVLLILLIEHLVHERAVQIRFTFARGEIKGSRETGTLNNLPMGHIHICQRENFVNSTLI